MPDSVTPAILRAGRVFTQGGPDRMDGRRGMSVIELRTPAEIEADAPGGPLRGERAGGDVDGGRGRA